MNHVTCYIWFLWLAEITTFRLEIIFQQWEHLTGYMVYNLAYDEILQMKATLLYKVPSKYTGKNFVTNVYCFYL